jgi:hypothetical protein
MVRAALLLSLLALGCAATEPRTETTAPVQAGAARAVDGLITALYASVSFGPGGGPDWEAFDGLVRADAIFVQAARGERPVQRMSMADFRADWDEFLARPGVRESGFIEDVVRYETRVWGHQAHAFVVFRPRVGDGTDRPEVLGVDSLELVCEDGRWWVAAITTQFETAERRVPARF